MEPAKRLRQRRRAAGLTQAQLADAAGVSRALVSAVEAGRHLPRIDGALALATVLGCTAEALFGSEPASPIDALTGRTPAEGAPIRLGFVAGMPVTAEPRSAGDGWEIVDGFAGELDTETLRGDGISLVVAGCEPGLVLMERLLRENGTRALAIGASSASASAALAAGRLHAAVAHFSDDAQPAQTSPETLRIHMARWRVGLAAPTESRHGWWTAALAGRTPVIQREPGAMAQETFERAMQTGEKIEGPGSPPLAFTFGLGGLAVFPLRFGATATLLEQATPPNMIEIIEKSGATVCFTAATRYAVHPLDTPVQALGWLMIAALPIAAGAIKYRAGVPIERR